jgi:N,N'-diacetyllegionaminate synthase
MKDIFSQKIIAETACGHNGDIKLLKKLIDIAKECRVKTIKFQMFEVKERAIPGTKEWSIFSKLGLSDTNWKTAINYAKKKKLNIIADVYGEKSFSLALKNNVDAFKVHSEDFFNTYFIIKVLETNKPVLISIGGTHRSELFDLVTWLKKKNKLNKNIYLVPGIQTFPTPIQAHHLSEITDLKKKYSKLGIKIAYADHIAGDELSSEVFPFMALSAGAEFVEKHYTDSRKLKRIDYHSALDQKQLKNFVINMSKLAPTLDNQGKFSIHESKYRKMFKKIPTINLNKKKGTKIKPTEIKFIKNTKIQSNLSSNYLVGRKINNDLKKNQAISLLDIKQKIGAVIVVRLNSVRFPNKAIKKINGVYSISLLIRRLKKIKELDQIILATSKNKNDDVLKKIAKFENIDFFRGSLDNVAKRYHFAAKKFKLDQIVRVTGDAILCDEVMISKAIRSQLRHNSDVTFINNMPYGTAKEVMNYKTIKIISEQSEQKKNTEYLEWYLENTRNFKVNYIKSNYKFNKSARLTLDFKQDLILFDKIFKFFKDKNANFTLKEALNLLNKKKKLIKINSFLTPKYKRNQINAELNI